MRFYLNADISYRVAEAVRQMDRSLDIASALELSHSRVPDLDELALATRQGRCLKTRNYTDFRRLTAEYQAAGLQHAGVLFVTKSLENTDIGAISRAIVRYIREHPDGLPPNMIDYLRR